MSERLPQSARPIFESRTEYDSQRNSQLYEPAFEAFEEVMNLGAGTPGLISYTVEANTIRRRLDFYAIDTAVDEGDEILFSDFSSIQLIRTPLAVEGCLEIEEYRRGLLKKLAKLTFREFIGDATAPFISEYRMETYSGGGVQALVSVTSPLRTQGLDERAMLPYDFKSLLHAIDRSASLLHRTITSEISTSGGDTL